MATGPYTGPTKPKKKGSRKKKARPKRAKKKRKG
jgi:hypothetical protein